MERPNPPVKIAEQQALKNSTTEEHEFKEILQGNYEEQDNSNNDNGHCFCLRKVLEQIWFLLIHASAGILNIMDLALIKVVNRFYYHNI